MGQLKTCDKLVQTLTALQVDPDYKSVDPLVLGAILKKKLRILLLQYQVQEKDWPAFLFEQDGANDLKMKQVKVGVNVALPQADE